MDILGYGVRILFSTRRIQDLGISSRRVRACARAFRRLQPHRLVHSSSLTWAQIVVELPFHKLRVLEGARPLTPTGHFLAVAQTSVTAVGDLHQMAQTLMPGIQQRLWAALPPGRKEHIETQQTGAQWFQQDASPDLVLWGDRPSDLDRLSRPF